MKQKRTSHAFLTEMMFVCAFFLVSSCVFVLVFAKAEQVSRRAENLNQAVRAAESAMEEIFSSDTPENAAALAAQISGEPSADGGFLLTVETGWADGLLTATVQAFAPDGTFLYSLEGAHVLDDNFTAANAHGTGNPRAAANARGTGDTRGGGA